MLRGKALPPVQSRDAVAPDGLIACTPLSAIMVLMAAK
jgi:hypothetical protein